MIRRKLSVAGDGGRLPQRWSRWVLQRTCQVQERPRSWRLWQICRMTLLNDAVGLLKNAS